jgi:predicted nucleic acid-binding protein
MKEKVFLDTNILMDIVEGRPNRQFAETIIELGKNGSIDLFASYLSYAYMGYIYRHLRQEERYRLIQRARNVATVLSCDALQLDNTLAQPVKDYEDMLQYQCALEAGCDVIITNNKRDFYEFCDLPFMTAEEYLLQYDGEI